MTRPAAVIGRTAADLPDYATATALHREDEAVLSSGQPQHYRLESRRTAAGAVSTGRRRRAARLVAPMRVCGSCGTENPDHARFCVSCGASLVPAEPNPVDVAWGADRPAPPLAPAVPHDPAYAGRDAADKRRETGRAVADNQVVVGHGSNEEINNWLIVNLLNCQ